MQVFCRLLTTIHLRYLSVATYSCMLCEGLYLARLLFFAFDESTTIVPYYILGWGPSRHTYLHM